MNKSILILLCLAAAAVMAGCGESEEAAKSPADLTKEIQKNNDPKAPEVPENLKNRGMMRGGKGGAAGTPAVQAPTPGSKDKPASTSTTE